MNNLIFSTKNIDDFANDVANEVVKKIELWGIKTPHLSDLPDRIGIDEALQFLNENGYRITKASLYKETYAKTIPFEKLGKHLVFSRKCLNQWIEDKTKKINTDEVAINLRREANNKLKRG